MKSKAVLDDRTKVTAERMPDGRLHVKITGFFCTNGDSTFELVQIGGDGSSKFEARVELRGLSGSKKYAYEGDFQVDASANKIDILHGCGELVVHCTASM